MANPSFILPCVQNMCKKWTFINDLSDGWEGVVEDNITKYLPKGADEGEESYKTRSELATYFDFFNPTIEGLKGLIFQKPIIINDDVPQQIQNLLSDMDSLGNDVNVVVNSLTDGAMRKGLKFAYVDMQTKLDEAVSQQEEDQLGIRPYVILIEPENVLNYKYENRDGNVILTQVTIQETISVEVGRFEVEDIVQYRVLTIGNVEVFDENFNLISSIETGLNEIPIVALNLDDTSKFLQANPPFYSLGKLNIRHFQVSTDTAWASHIANVPVFQMLGFNKDDVGSVSISANKAVVSTNSDAKIGWVDFEGKNIETNMKVSESYEKQIALLGLSIIADGQFQQTATETVVQTKQKQSTINTWVTAIEDAVSKIFYYMGLYYNLDNGGTVEIDADILTNLLSPEEMRIYSDMVSRNELSLETMWAMMKNNRKLPRDFDPDVEQERLSNQGLLTDNSNI